MNVIVLKYSNFFYFRPNLGPIFLLAYFFFTFALSTTHLLRTYIYRQARPSRNALWGQNQTPWAWFTMKWQSSSSSFIMADIDIIALTNTDKLRTKKIRPGPFSINLLSAPLKKWIYNLKHDNHLNLTKPVNVSRVQR